MKNQKTRIYRHEVVNQLLRIYQGVLLPHERVDSVSSYLSSIADRMVSAMKCNEQCIYVEMNNYNPDFIGTSINELSEMQFELVDIQLTVAKQYGYESWQEVQDVASEYDYTFESAI